MGYFMKRRLLRFVCCCLGHRYRMLRVREGRKRIGGLRCSRCGWHRVRILFVDLTEWERLRLLANCDQFAAKHPGVLRNVRSERVDD